MANQGIYREAGGAGGLPLPRSNLLLLTLAVALLALLSVALSPALLFLPGRNAAGAWRIFRDGGLAMWLVLLLDILAPFAVAVLGAFVLRGRRVPSGLLFVTAAVPFGVALLGAWGGLNRVIGAVSGDAIDPEQKARILAEGLAESMSLDLFGGFVACGVAVSAAAAAAAAVASIDTAAASRGGPKPPSFGAIGAAAAGATWIVATLALGAVRIRDGGGGVLLAAMPVIAVVLFAVIAGRNAAVLRRWHDRDEAARAAGAIIVAGLAALLAVIAMQRALEASFAAQAFGAISGESVDESMRARILGSALEAGRLAPLAYGLHAVLGTSTFALALAPAIGSARATPSVVLAGLFALALALGAAGLAHARAGAPRAVAMRSAAAPSGVTLPVVVDSFSHRGTSPGYGTRLVVKRDGTGEGTVESASCAAATKLIVYADRDATMATLRARLGPPQTPPCSRHAVFVVAREHPKELDERLGDLAAYLGNTAYFAATLDGDPEAGGGALRVTSEAADTVEIDGARMKLPLAPLAPLDIRVRTARIRYVFRPGDSIGQVIATIAAVETAYAARLSTWDLEREIDDGVPPPAPPPAQPDRQWAGRGISVDGRIPPEVVQRIILGHLGPARRCYDTALSRKPTLQGRVIVKFVIDRSGAVVAATDEGSDLPDRIVIACVVKTFEKLSFPQPESGIVLVVYPMTFQSGS